MTHRDIIPKMSNLKIACAILFIVAAFVQCAHSLAYSDLDTLGIVCSDLEDRYKCDGYSSSLDPIQRGCECDSSCNRYRDCCINALRRRPAVMRSSTRTRYTCLHIGERFESGVFVVSRCKNTWDGLEQIRQKCEGADDYSDPFNAAPVTNVSSGVTYRNHYCAECNNANMQNLTAFLLKMACPGTEFMNDTEIYAGLKYNSSMNVWGMDSVNSQNITDFIRCNLTFDVPSYLSNSVRYCHLDMISSCPQNFSRESIITACGAYKAVVYDVNAIAYRNPHCAICNGNAVDEIFCTIASIIGRNPRPPPTPGTILDINGSDGDLYGITERTTVACRSNQIYDPFTKTCRRLRCVLPGHVVRNGKCVRR